MKRLTPILILSAAIPLFAMAADPAPPQADPEPRLKRSPPSVTHAAPEGRVLLGPEDFLLPAPTDSPRAVTEPASSEPVTGTRQRSVPSALEGF